MSDGSGTSYGRYLGRLIIEPLPDGRLMRLVEPFGFLDAREKRWPVPVGAKVDGASIPQALWSLVGGPFEGKYRDASVIHDYYCDIRSEPWRAVHQVFYEAMRVSGVAERRAKLMYAAVYFAGPRWSETAVENANLPRLDDPKTLYSVQHTEFQLGVLEAVDVAGESARAFLRSGKVMWPEGNETRLDLKRMQDLIESSNPSLAEIDRAINEAVEVLEPPWRSNERNRLVVPNGSNPL
jgi:uncharacterized protein DUF1353